MSQESEHKRILLNKNTSGKVEYCESCNMVEMAIGPVSVRLYAQDLEALSVLLQGANQQLIHYKEERQRFDVEVVVFAGLH